MEDVMAQIADRMKRYSNVRNQMRPGDVIAFGGKGHFSEIIKFATRSEVSHVGVIFQVDRTGRQFKNLIIESTSLNGKSGVQINFMSQRVRNYEGEVWWLPLDKPCSDFIEKSDKFFEFLRTQIDKEYDMGQAIKAGLDIFDDVWGVSVATLAKEDFDKFFCSELVVAGLEAAGVFGKVKVNASEVTPIDLCRLKLYGRDRLPEAGRGYYQIGGDREKRITRFNTIPFEQLPRAK